MKTHLVGVGGIGMSGIAQLLLAKGDRVSGSDTSESSLLAQIRAKGATIWKGHAASHVDGAGRVVYSSSITPQNPELKAARNRGIPVQHRAQMIFQLVGPRRMVAVAGSHGKSTTTALSAQLLVAAGWDPMAIVGAEVEAFDGTVRAGHGPYAVVEADESDGSFLWFRPHAAVITNIDEEHLDYFRNFGEIIEVYAAFVDRVSPSGLVIGCADDPGVRRLLAANSRRQISYGLSPEAQISAADLEIGPGWSRFRCLRSDKTLGTIHLQIPGSHNVLNSLAVIALGQGLGIDFKAARQALENYRGAKRRFQIQGEVNGVMVVEDYAHHPAEIQSTLQAARGWKGRRIRCVFQPHRYSRTRYLLSRFGSSFALADEVTLLPIYAASEEPLDGIDSDVVLRAVQAGGKPDARLESPEEALARLAAGAMEGDLILFLGAGNVGELAPRLVQMLEARSNACVETARGAPASKAIENPSGHGSRFLSSFSRLGKRESEGSILVQPATLGPANGLRSRRSSRSRVPAYAEFKTATGGRVRFDEPMRLHTTFHLGGPAEIWVEPQDSEELRAVLRIARDTALPVTVIGGGANLLVRDEGIPGLVIHLGSQKFQECRRTADGLAAGAGLPLEWLIRRAMQKSLTGVEFLAGVPGRVGGATRMNAGTHDDQGKIHNFSDVVRSITVMDFSGDIHTLAKEQIGFAYRSSHLPDRIVLEVEMVLPPDDPKAIADRVKRLWEFKKKTQDWTAPSAGCIFKNPAGPHAAGWLVDHAGLKGFQIGGAAVSRRHANFMVNIANAKAADLFALIGEVQHRVQRQFGVALELEVQVLPSGHGSTGSP